MTKSTFHASAAKFLAESFDVGMFKQHFFDETSEFDEEEVVVFQGLWAGEKVSLKVNVVYFEDPDVLSIEAKSDILVPDERMNEVCILLCAINSRWEQGCLTASFDVRNYITYRHSIEMWGAVPTYGMPRNLVLSAGFACDWWADHIRAVIEGKLSGREAAFLSRNYDEQGNMSLNVRQE